MATANSTRRSAGSSLSTQTDEFAALSRRLLVAVNQVMLVSQHFGDLAGLSREDAPAGLTLHQAAKDLDRLYNELDAWDVRHEHFSKSAGRQLDVGVFTDDTAERSPLPGFPPAAHCPFCGRHDDIVVSQTAAAEAEHGQWYRAHCGICGVDAPGAATALEAAQQWNSRPHTVGADARAQSAPATSDATALPPIGASDQTADRIRAFLMSVRPLQGVADIEGGEKYQRGRALIERMALSAKEEEDPTIVLSPQHCADVLSFLRNIEPLAPRTWWEDPADAPSHVVGFVFVLRTLECSLRSKEAQS